jgi:hypothetical protein
VEEISSVEPVPLIRVYAVYPKDKSGNVWFHGLNRTITDNYIRQIIPIDTEKGLVMISYTDGTYADMWSNLSKLGNKVLIDHLHKAVKSVLGKTPPKPTFITSHYWSEGVHMWKPGFDMNQEYQKIQQPFSNERIYVVNEAFSKHQGWMEGSLDMCYDVLETINSGFKRGKPKKRGSKQKGKSKQKRTSKIYSIQEVLRHKNWIVLDIKRKLRIYDVTKWLQDHPGGKANLQKGIKATRHYVNPRKYPESPSHLFKQIEKHSSGKVVQNMLLKKNDNVKYIGLMKKV